MANIISRYVTISYSTDPVPETTNLFISYDKETDELTVEHDGGILPLTTDVFVAIARFLIDISNDEKIDRHVVVPFDKPYRFIYDCQRNTYGYEITQCDGRNPRQYHILSEEEHRFYGRIVRPAPILYQLCLAIGTLKVFRFNNTYSKNDDFETKAVFRLRRPRDLSTEPGWVIPNEGIPNTIAAING